MEEPRKVALRAEHDEGGARFMDAWLTPEGDLLISGQDLGRGVTDFFGSGSSEYEWAWLVKRAELPRLVAALGGEPGGDVLALLAARFSGPAAAGLQAFLEGAAIPFESWSRVGA